MEAYVGHLVLTIAGYALDFISSAYLKIKVFAKNISSFFQIK